jgi:hypothetical protein
MMFLSRVGGAPSQYLYRFMRDVLGLHKLSCEPFRRGRRGQRMFTSCDLSLKRRANNLKVLPHSRI